MKPRARINLSRLRKNLKDLSRFGRGASGGITRESFSEDDRQAKKWLIDLIREAGLHARMDEAGNVFGRLGPEGPAVLSGSHLDTVPEGGMFDGALGVLAALECLQIIHEQRLPHKYPLEMVAFSDEEGAYHSFLGSRALTGSISAEELARAKNMRGVALRQAVAQSGLDIEKFSAARRDPREIRAYLELHIEQGPQLEIDQVPIGIVRSIVGIESYWMTFVGESNHAGTTPLPMRRDALLGAAEFSLRVNDRIRSDSSGVVTMGDIIVSPGAFNVVPREARLALEFRDASSDRLKEMGNEIMEIGHHVARQRDLTFMARRVSWEAPVVLSQRVQSVLKEEADTLEYPYRLMDSGAGHDAQILAQKAEVGMIFIPSLGGKSHCPQERSGWEDVEKGAQLLLRSLLRLTNEDQATR
jgi:N-carbamoyl-L-amino-acid hydrolase